MSSLLPLRPDPSGPDERDADPKLVDLTGPEADRILPAVASTTAREILESVYDEPRTASDIAEVIDTSVQNVGYHVERLRDAGLIEVVGTWYSGQGREMDVYAPANGPLVLYVGAERARPSLAAALARTFGAVCAVGLASAVAHVRWAAPPVTPMSAPEPAEQTLGESVAAFVTGPGGFVLAAGLLAVGCLVAYWYWRRYRPYRERVGPDAASS